MQRGSEGHAHLKLPLLYLGRAIGSLASCLAHPVASDWGLNGTLGGRPHCRIDNLAQLRQECCAWFPAGLGREKLGFCGHGRQPVRSQFITGHDPGSRERESVCVSQYLRFCIVSPFSCRGPNHLVSNPERITSALLNGFEPEGNGCVS
jgi:hypothetical protein